MDRLCGDRGALSRAANDVQPDWRGHLQNTKKSDVSAKALQATGKHSTGRTNLAYGIIWDKQSLDDTISESSMSLFFGNILFERILSTVVTRAFELSGKRGSAGSTGLAIAFTKRGTTVTADVTGKFSSIGRFDGPGLLGDLNVGAVKSIPEGGYGCFVPGVPGWPMTPSVHAALRVH